MSNKSQMSNTFKFGINNIVKIKNNNLKIYVSSDQNPKIIQNINLELMDSFNWDTCVIVDRKNIDGKNTYTLACLWFKYVGIYYALDIPEEYLEKNYKPDNENIILYFNSLI